MTMQYKTSQKQTMSYHTSRNIFYVYSPFLASFYFSNCLSSFIISIVLWYGLDQTFCSPGLKRIGQF